MSKLTEKEKDALRLLLAGHDAKSSARVLELSVHTLNERLRDSRRKLGVSSSKEAARLLAAEEDGEDNSLGYKRFGVGSGVAPAANNLQPARRWWKARKVQIPGVILMVVTALAALLFAQAPNPPSTTPSTMAATTPVNATSEERSARNWLAAVDAAQWKTSWSNAASVFRNQISSAQWAAAIEPARIPLGKVISRTLLSAQRTSFLPGAPQGDYIVLQFSTGFSAQPKSVETVTLMREASVWKVAGYFIKPA